MRVLWELMWKRVEESGRERKTHLFKVPFLKVLFSKCPFCSSFQLVWNFGESANLFEHDDGES